MARKKILIVGFGTVGQGFFELLQTKMRSKRLGFEDDVIISEIASAKLGHIKNPATNEIQDLKTKAKKIGEASEVVEIIKRSDADILCEFTGVDIKNNAEPAFSHMKEALQSGKNVLTTNKGPIALRYHELKDLAKGRGLQIKFKGTVMAGTPSYNLLELLPGIEVRRIRGILNGTTNFILAEMERGKTFEQGLRLAQSSGYAEANPAMDVDGYDSALKAIIISNVLGWFSKGHSLVEMEIKGIRNLEDQQNSSKRKIKLLVRADETQASVKPEPLESEDILANVGGVLNALEIETDTLGKIISIGPGAGKFETAQAVISDLSSILAVR